MPVITLHPPDIHSPVQAQQVSDALVQRLSTILAVPPHLL